MVAEREELKTFFDPHPGYAGAAIPLPKTVVSAAQELNGKRVSLREAMEKIKEATSDEDEVVATENAILLKQTRGLGLRHTFCVIRFKS